MAYHKEPFTLLAGKLKDGRKVWYYRTYTPDGKRTSARSTGQTSKAEAYKHCEALAADGKLIPGPKPPKPAGVTRRRIMTLSEYAQARSWWKWTDAGPVCEYCRGELKRSAEGRPAIQRRQADDSARIFKDKIEPAHGAKRLDQISPLDCEDLMSAWADDGKSNKTINNFASVYRVMFREAARLGFVVASPWASVKGYQPAAGGKGILSIKEYKTLMDPRAIARWRHVMYYDICLLASVTGLRIGECLALHPENVFADHIEVSKSWNIEYGEGPQKTKRGTDQIPVPKFVADRLLTVAGITPTGGYIFSLSDGKRPGTANRVNDALTDALEKIGITDEIRRKRKISFHSWRAFANTYFRHQGVPDAKVRVITRHESEDMTELYTPWRLEDFREIAEAQAQLIAEIES
jgi:integrase